jgi:hypothetical protein
MLPADEFIRWSVEETLPDKDGKKFVLIRENYSGRVELRPYDQYVVEQAIVEPLCGSKIIDRVEGELIIRQRTESDPVPYNEAKPVKGLEEFFMVTPNGDLYSRRTNRTVSQTVGSTGYPQHATKIGGRKGKAVLIKTHRAVAQAFVPNPENKPDVNHMNGIKTDPRAPNLEWNTHQENVQHAYATGLTKALKGTEVYNAKLSEQDVREIREKAESTSRRALGREYGVDHTVILDVLAGKSYTNVV